MKTYIYNFFKIFVLAFSFLAIIKGSIVEAKEVEYKKLYVQDNNEEISVDKIKNGFNISIENDLEEGGHTTAYFSPSLVENAAGFGAFSFCVENKSEGELKFNYVVNGVSKNYPLQDEDVVFTKSSEEEDLRRLKVENGVFQIEEGFKGKVYIPFASLIEGEFGTIQSWGFTITCRNGESKNFNISDFNYVERGLAEKYNDLAKISIEGDIKVPVPSVGESIIDYKIKEEAKFYINEDYKGVTVSEKGHLAINSEAETGRVKVFVSLAKDEGFYFDVVLEESLTKSLMGVTNKSLATPTLNEVVNEESSFIKFLLKDSVIFIFRTMLTLIAASILGVYLNWRGYIKKITKD